MGTRRHLACERPLPARLTDRSLLALDVTFPSAYGTSGFAAGHPSAVIHRANADGRPIGSNA